ncbi:Gfo/Idh/MocA family oxidoreductase [Reichenbachiella carrageenanivorans]|uniref:Gfo/Idh/MocA family oxidoreductase n=1 Tax=Reichenbachiella carrageenanivorans TaxID=2979869 RepID=A0ABY6D2M1_9BACT|nr:Gfo/Idh/MocA family oxidoreductase [Reichenbachiella carrageenanivorans]UXX80407.1 Gfo/Idh/MocA family oxidoreductase [Reichenbachiella carrageenanivorans]
MKKIALVGCGIWGMKILSELVNLGCEVTVFDETPTVPDEVKALGIDFFHQGCPTDVSYDGIIVATPSTTHRQVLEKLLPLQTPIFLEKPLTTSLDDAKALAAIVHEHVYLMHIWLYHPGILAIAEIVKSNELGKLKGIRSTRANWTSPRKDTDSVWNLAPHDVTITKAILGQIPQPKYAVVENHQGTIRGMYAVLGKYPYSIFEVSNRYENKRREVRAHFEKGVVVLQDEKVKHIDIHYGDDQSEQGTKEVEKRSFDPTPPLRLEVKEFVEYLNGGPKPRSNFQEGLEVIEVIDQLITLAK